MDVQFKSPVQIFILTGIFSLLVCISTGSRPAIYNRYCYTNSVYNCKSNSRNSCIMYMGGSPSKLITTTSRVFGVEILNSKLWFIFSMS